MLGYLSKEIQRCSTRRRVTYGGRCIPLYHYNIEDLASPDSIIVIASLDTSIVDMQMFFQNVLHDAASGRRDDGRQDFDVIGRVRGHWEWRSVKVNKKGLLQNAASGHRENSREYAIRRGGGHWEWSGTRWTEAKMAEFSGTAAYMVLR